MRARASASCGVSRSRRGRQIAGHGLVRSGDYCSGDRCSGARSTTTIVRTARAVPSASSAIASPSAVSPASMHPPACAPNSAPRPRPVRRISCADQALAISTDVSADLAAGSWTGPMPACRWGRVMQGPKPWQRRAPPTLRRALTPPPKFLLMRAPQTPPSATPPQMGAPSRAAGRIERPRPRTGQRTRRKYGGRARFSPLAGETLSDSGRAASSGTGARVDSVLASSAAGSSSASR